MAVKSAVVDNLNHISHFHTFLSQFSQFSAKACFVFYSFGWIMSYSNIFGSLLEGGERIPDSKIITDQFGL